MNNEHVVGMNGNSGPNRKFAMISSDRHNRVSTGSSEYKCPSKKHLKTIEVQGLPSLMNVYICEYANM